MSLKSPCFPTSVSAKLETSTWIWGKSDINRLLISNVFKVLSGHFFKPFSLRKVLWMNLVFWRVTICGRNLSQVLGHIFSMRLSVKSQQPRHCLRKPSALSLRWFPTIWNNINILRCDEVSWFELRSRSSIWLW